MGLGFRALGVLWGFTGDAAECIMLTITPTEKGDRVPWVFQHRGK